MGKDIFLCMPKRGDNDAVDDAVEMFALATSRDHVRMKPTSSILPYTFNAGWAAMLNLREEYNFKYFAMQHTDVVPVHRWLDKMIDELESCGADVLSAVIPIKDDLGLTSTAKDNSFDEWNPRNITLREIFKRPETFTEHGLLLNTGLWVCRVGQWCESMFFRQQDRIVREDGKWVEQTISEDWDFSRRAALRGKKLFATRKIHLYHGKPKYHNREPWGTLEE